MLKKIVFISLSFLVSLTSLNAQTFGKYAGEFMAIGIGGRPLGMGGSFTGIADDVTSGYDNPAGLADINYPQLSLMHSEQFGNLVNYDYGAFAIPFQEDMSFGFSVMPTAVAVGTANFIDPTSAVKVIEGLHDYRAANGIAEVRQLVGRIQIPGRNTK